MLGVVNLSERWLEGMAAANRMGRGTRQDFSYVNVGDSIAAGRWGITSKSQHYAAVAARMAAEQLSLPVRCTLHTPDDLPTGDPAPVDGPGWPVVEGGLYGGGSYQLDGDRRTLRYDAEPGCRTVRVRHSGAFDYSVNGGGSWSRRTSGPGGLAGRSEIALRDHGLAIRAASNLGCRIDWLQSVDPDRPGIAWYTSGIGGSRIDDLHRMLSTDADAGYRAYGAAEPDLLTLAIGVNDTIHADVETVRGSRAALRAVIARLHAYGVANVALVGPVPVRADFQPGPWRVADAYREIYRPVARETDIPLLDLAARWGDYDAAYASGYQADQVHPSPAGHADAGQLVAALLVTAVTA